MFRYFFERRKARTKAYELYSDLVNQARRPEFYTQYGVQDSIEGRFDMILLHLFLVDDRLSAEGDQFIPLRRYLQEAMVSDMDRSFREMGIGDMSVGKEMKKVGAAWLGRRAAYKAALEDGASEDMLHDVLAKNLYDIESEAPLLMMGTYVRHVKKLLSLTSTLSVKDCKFVFPSPAE
ncbi:ubiquinol-cytochrome C chaperone family protein [Kordiimonas pumila]|uniref:Ubiquinol-cytochrome C chaperone family protein n=1 Tax=Kordiimonas pumila TaxID=2161677 RepID=A0ABV7D2B4_9PROT|nr:ubiquinol-cytochrome C chaperone family protein [Kordiimonas pumila]